MGLQPALECWKELTAVDAKGCAIPEGWRCHWESAVLITEDLDCKTTKHKVSSEGRRGCSAVHCSSRLLRDVGGRCAVLCPIC